MVKSGIYKIKNEKNGKVYIGSAKSFSQRWSSHKSSLLKQKHRNSYLQRAWIKYGESAFKFSILENVLDKYKLIEREQYWLDYYKSYIRKLGYNICSTAGSSLGIMHTDVTKLKISKSKTGKSKGRKGICFTIQHRKNISTARINMFKKHPELLKQQSLSHKGQLAWNKGIPCTDKVKSAISKANKGKRLGKYHSKQTIEKIRQAHIGKVVSEKTRKKISLSKKGKSSNSPTKFKKGCIPTNKGKIFNKFTHHYE